MTYSRSWIRVAIAMFAVGWGANQFSPMLIVYRHELGLSATAVAGLFAVYAATLVPGLLAGGPASDRFGRRAVALPFIVLSPVATALLVIGSSSLAAIAAGRALAGLCSGVVFGSATAWVQELSPDPAMSARRAALALTAGFGLGPVVAAMLAQWAGDPLVVPYLPHLVIGVAAVAVVCQVRSPVRSARAEARRLWPPAPVRRLRFWLSVAPAAPLVFGSVSVAIVVLPEEVTSAHQLSAGFAGLMTALAFCAGVAIQPAARRLEARAPLAGSIAGLCAGAAGAAVAIPAVAAGDRPLAGIAAVLLGLAYGLTLVAGLQQAGELVGAEDRGAVVACYYALAYLGFAAPYLVTGLNAAFGRQGALVALAFAAGGIAVWTAAVRGIARRPAAVGVSLVEPPWQPRHAECHARALPGAAGDDLTLRGDRVGDVLEQQRRGDRADAAWHR